MAELTVGECWLGVQDAMGSTPISSINCGGDRYGADFVADEIKLNGTCDECRWNYIT
jgi:hypothetical protein